MSVKELSNENFIKCYVVRLPTKLPTKKQRKSYTLSIINTGAKCSVMDIQKMFLMGKNSVEINKEFRVSKSIIDVVIDEIVNRKLWLM